MENIWVGVRIKPPQNKSTIRNWRVHRNSISVCNSMSQASHVFQFDTVFGPEVCNADVYNGQPKQLTMDAVRGFNGTIFAYGQTSSGKTHTMRGTTKDPGIIPLAIYDVFKHLEMVIDREFLIRVSYMEIYNEEIKDLLSPESSKLEIYENHERGVFVAGLKELIVTCPSHALNLLEFGEAHRHFGDTNMNANSSRSHTIFRMVIESKLKTQPSGTDLIDSDAVRVSTLHMVDLAGFERISKTGAGGTRLREGVYINKSLVTLSNVIKKLSDGINIQRGHIPYRDSKLTRILQPVLGGNAKISIICTVSSDQAHNDESRGTLMFAKRAKKVTTTARINETITDAALLRRQQKEIEELRRKLQGMVVKDLDEEILKLRNELLKVEVEKEKLVLQLLEEQKAQAEKDLQLREKEKKIEDLSTMVMNCSSDSDTFVNPILKRGGDYLNEGTPNHVNVRNIIPFNFPSYEDYLCASESSQFLSEKRDMVPLNYSNIADEDTWFALNNSITTREQILGITPFQNCQQSFTKLKNKILIQDEDFDIAKLLDENRRLKEQLAEKEKMNDLTNCLILRILEFEDRERSMKQMLKNAMLLLFEAQEKKSASGQTNNFNLPSVSQTEITGNQGIKGDEDMCNITDVDELVTKRSETNMHQPSHKHFSNTLFSSHPPSDDSFEIEKFYRWKSCLREEDEHIASELLGKFNIQVERNKSLEADVTTLEICLVNLRVEIDSLQQCVPQKSPTEMEIELQQLRNQCESYKNEIELIMEQVPTAEQDAKRWKHYFKVREDNCNLRLRLKRLERKMKLRKDNDKLKRISREKDLSISRLEGAVKRNEKLEQRVRNSNDKVFDVHFRGCNLELQRIKDCQLLQNATARESNVFGTRSKENGTLRQTISFSPKQKSEKVGIALEMKTQSKPLIRRSALKDKNRHMPTVQKGHAALYRTVDCDDIANKENNIA